MNNSVFAEPRLVTSASDCLFYHTVDLPQLGTFKGFWDIRGKESEYLGNFDVNGKKVLEIGPASGHLSFFMERKGAQVVSIEAIDEKVWELFWRVHETLPKELDELLTGGRKTLHEIKNSYWFCHQAFSSRAKVHYGNAYNFPPDLGKFDVAVMACMLLHNKNPLQILENCARITSEAIIIVEPIRPAQFSQSLLEFVPTGDEMSWDTWWGFSPKFFVDVLRSLDFNYATVTRHTQICFDKPQDMFTIVARREVSDEKPVRQTPQVEVLCPVERLRLAAGGHLHLPVTVRSLGEASISSFTAEPLLISYHWRSETGEVAVWNGLRTTLPYPLEKGNSDEILVAVRAPDEPGNYVLEVTMLREDVEWYDNSIPGLPVRIPTVVKA